MEIDVSLITDPVAALGAFGASAALGFVKTQTGALDNWLGRKIRPVQPLVVALGAFGLPLLANALGIATVDPELFASAPTATVAAITAREVLARIRKGSD